MYYYYKKSLSTQVQQVPANCWGKQRKLLRGWGEGGGGDAVGQQQIQGEEC